MKHLGSTEKLKQTGNTELEHQQAFFSGKPVIYVTGSVIYVTQTEGIKNYLTIPDGSNHKSGKYVVQKKAVSKLILTFNQSAIIYILNSKISTT